MTREVPAQVVPTQEPLDGPVASVAFVGAGPGGPDLLTLGARDRLARADVIVHDSDARRVGVLDGALRHARRDATVLALPRPAGRRGHESEPSDAAVLVEAALARADEAAREATREAAHGARRETATAPGELLCVVRLVPGCPTTFRHLEAEVRACREAGLAVEIIPGVSSLTGAPAYAGMSLASDDRAALLLWGSTDVASGSPLGPGAAAVLMGGAAAVADDLAALLAGGLDPRTDAALIERATTIAQRSRHAPVGELGPLLPDDDAWVVVVIGAPAAHDRRVDWFESKPLFGWRVLVPRTKDQAGSMLERLVRYGAHGEVVPTIAVEPPRSPAKMRKAITGLVEGRYTWIGFTSVNAVRAIRESFAELGLDARSLAGLRIAAVGGVTAAALRDWGIEPDLLPAGEESARGLLASWPAYDAERDPLNGVLLPRADIATETLVAGLTDLGWTVDDVTAYRTVRAAPPPAEIRAAIKGGRFDAVVFTSSSTVRNLIGIAGKPHPSTVVACIGQATAQTAREHGLQVHVVAPTASAEALIDALAAYGGSRARPDRGS